MKKGRARLSWAAIGVLVWLAIAAVACHPGAGAAPVPDALIVTGIEKGTVTTITNGQGSITATVNFDPSTPVTQTMLEAGQVAMTYARADGTGTSSTAAITCDTAGTQCTATLAGLDGCHAWTDYTVTVTAGTAVYAATFNSTDDEFNWSVPVASMVTASTLSNPSDVLLATTCWLEVDADGDVVPANAVSVDPAAGTLTVSFGADDDRPSVIVGKGFAGDTSGDKAFVVRGSSAGRDATAAHDLYEVGGFMDYHAAAAVQTTRFAGRGQAPVAIDGYSLNVNQTVTGGSDINAFSYLVSPGDPFFFCLTEKNGTPTYYMSADGVTFIAMTSPPMTIESDGSGSLSSQLSVNPSSSPTIPFYLAGILAMNQAGKEEESRIAKPSFAPTYDFMRWRMTNLTGTDADCTSLLTYGLTKTR